MTSPTSGKEVVLVVEDDATVRRAVCRILQLHGYEVLQANNGEEALRTIPQQPKPVDLVITDVVMPQMEGTKLVSLLRTSYPAMRVLFMSGYSADYLQMRGAAEDAAFMPKPFTFDGLARRVREVLDGAS